MNEKALPNDVHEDSRCRLPLPKREDLDDAAKALFDQLCDPNGPSLVGLQGPGGIRLHSPGAAVNAQPLNRYLRWETGFGGRTRELAILVTAREHDNQFEWAAHEPAALKEGVSEEIVDLVKNRRSTDGLSEGDAVVIEFGRELFGQHRVSSETFARALKIFGPRDLVDLVSLMGMYAATAALLTAFDIQLRPGEQAILPLP